jgi:hypothetical protein
MVKKQSWVDDPAPSQFASAMALPELKERIKIARYD